ncbi:MAG: hypothetical protein E6559_21880 [Pantoea sp.]|nr:hypothetical protein [Pantoea sp.]MDU6442500.1 hypothetical protein [Pantoea sp.]
MMELTEEQRKALIADCEAQIRESKDKICAYESRLGWDRAEKEKSVLARQQIALAALTAEPVAYRWEAVGSGRIKYDGIRPIGVVFDKLYTEPPVAALSLTQMQIDWICNTCASIYHTSNDDVAQGYIDEIRATLERLNATAPEEKPQ